MTTSKSDRPGRRDLLTASGAVAALMLQPGWLVAACSRAPELRNDPRFAFVDRLSELTIPTTDTPGASAAGVPAFVLLALDQGMNGLRADVLTRVRDGLDHAAGGSFLAASEQEQIRHLTALDSAAYGGEHFADSTPQHAWTRVKAAIVAGYYASETGASTELVYEPVPTRNDNITLPADYRARSNEGHGESW